jgi:NAD(P)H-flavin reductase
MRAVVCSVVFEFQNIPEGSLTLVLAILAPLPASMYSAFWGLHNNTSTRQVLYTCCARVTLAVSLTSMESEWLRDAIRFSLKSSAYTISIDDGPGSPGQRDPRFRKLIEGLLFSRRFILTYHLVILGIITAFSASHWIQKAFRWRKRRALRLQTRAANDAFDGDTETIKPDSYAPTDEEGIYSSGSSTIEGTASPPRKDIDEDEETPLLHQSHGSRRLYPLRSILSLWKAILMYQPPPIPIVNKVLPSNGTSIAIGAFIAINIFYIYYNIHFNMFETFVLADRFGLVFVANIPLLYLLAAKNQPLKFLTGRSYESLNIFHRRLGELLCLEALFHFVGMIVVWYTLFRPGGFGLVKFLLLKVILLGIGAFLSYEILYLTSLASFRQRWYELFLGVHIILQVAALIFVFFHHSTARPYVAVSLGIFLVDRLVYRLWIKSTTMESGTKILEDEETIKLSTSIVQRSGSRILAPLGIPITAGWQATDHVFITVPSLSRKHIVQAHPFTIASAAPSPADEVSRLELLIRAQDGFSRDLLNASRLHKSLNVRIDGPYGSPHARIMLEDSGLAIIVAGGSGIAGGWPLVEHLLNITQSSDTEIATTHSLRKQNIVLIWVIHDSTHISWVGRLALADAETRGAEIIIPRATDEIGRPDLKKMIHDVVGRYCDERSKKIRVVASGPDGMGRLVRNTCAGLVLNGRDADVMIEKFGW